MLPAIWSLEGFGLRLGHPRADGVVNGEVQGGVLTESVLLAHRWALSGGNSENSSTEMMCGAPAKCTGLQPQAAGSFVCSPPAWSLERGRAL